MKADFNDIDFEKENDKLIDNELGNFKENLTQKELNVLRQQIRNAENLEEARNRLSELMLQSIYGAKYKVGSVNKNRMRYRRRNQYRLGFVYAKLRQTRLQMLHLYSAVDNLLRIPKTKNLQAVIAVIALYERILQLYVDVTLLFELFVKIDEKLIERKSNKKT